MSDPESKQRRRDKMNREKQRRFNKGKKQQQPYRRERQGREAA